RRNQCMVLVDRLHIIVGAPLQSRPVAKDHRRTALELRQSRSIVVHRWPDVDHGLNSPNSGVLKRWHAELKPLLLLRFRLMPRAASDCLIANRRRGCWRTPEAPD